MKKEDRQAVNGMAKLLKSYCFDEMPEESARIYRLWARGLITADEAVQLWMKSLKEVQHYEMV